jgi:hypothetical protein
LKAILLRELKLWSTLVLICLRSVSVLVPVANPKFAALWPLTHGHGRVKTIAAIEAVRVRHQREIFLGDSTGSSLVRLHPMIRPCGYLRIGTVGLRWRARQRTKHAEVSELAWYGVPLIRCGPNGLPKESTDAIAGLAPVGLVTWFVFPFAQPSQ